jgi:3-hydroxyisobutyrate dehydrogenase-like beta-hydroxyacid dehydrogenase
MSESIGFIGLGNMGQEMALRLVEAGWPVRVWNRTREKAAELAKRGATLVERPEEAVEPGGIAISMLADDAALLEHFAGNAPLVARLGAKGLHISMSTIHPETSRRLAREHAEHGASYLCAPVFGRPNAARTGMLWIALSGRPEDRLRARPIFEAMGQGIFEFGDDPGAANIAKLCGNFMIAAAVEAMAEAAALAEKSGVGAAGVLEMLGKTLFACPIYQGYGQLVVKRKFEPAGFRMRLGLKDVELAISAARAVGVPMPLADIARNRALVGLNRGRGDWDWSAVSLGAAEDAGMV